MKIKNLFFNQVLKHDLLCRCFKAYLVSVNKDLESADEVINNIVKKLDLVITDPNFTKILDEDQQQYYLTQYNLWSKIKTMEEKPCSTLKK